MLDRIEVSDRSAAAVFRSPRQRRILLSLIERERSLGQLAELTGTPLNLLHHHVRKFVALGLATLSRREARAGSPIKFYRAASNAFFVPAEFMDADPGAASSRLLRESLERGLAGAVKGMLYSGGEEGPRMRLVREPNPKTVAAETWLDLRLSRADAAALADELNGVMRRFRDRADESQRRYLIHAAIAPA